MATTETAVRVRSLGPLDRGLYALFSGHADSRRHDRDRANYRAAALSTSFELYLARVYGLSWLALVTTSALATVLVLVVPGELLATAVDVFLAVAPGRVVLSPPQVPRPAAAGAAGLLAGLLAKRGTVRLGGTYLRWTGRARSSAIRRTLPGAVRYLRVLATGTDDSRRLLRTVAEQDAYGETAVAFRTVLNRSALAGSLEDGLRSVARDTPSRDLLAPFLLKFHEHASQGSDALRGYLRMESRMLSHRQARERQRAADLLELLAELFIVLLVFPALLVVIVTILSVLAPSLSEPVSTPFGAVTLRTGLIATSALFVLVVGACAALLVDAFRPPSQRPPSHRRPAGLTVLATALSNPASAAVCFLPIAGLVAVGLAVLGARPATVVLLGYVAYGFPVGLVAVRRARLDDAKDREMRDFVHAVAGHVSLGQPFEVAVERVARDVDLGPLQADVEDLAFGLGVTTAPEADQDVRAAALDRFVERVGTPLAEQTIGLVTGALAVGSDTEAVFETLQTEVGRLYHARKKLRSQLLVYVAVGWTTALLVVGIVVAVNAYVLDGFAQLSAVSNAGGHAGLAIDTDAVSPERDRYRFYLVTQATMLACGWFAGTASRGRYEALLHSATLVAVCYLVFAGAGMI